MLALLNLIEVGERLALRFKTVPFVCLVQYTLSNRLQKAQNFNPYILAIAYPFTLVLLTEIVA